MTAAQDLLDSVPAWVLRPLPINATVDPELLRQVEKYSADLPASLFYLQRTLDAAGAQVSYDAAANLACAAVWRSLKMLMQSDYGGQSSLISLALRHFTPRARLRVLRRLAKSSEVSIRRLVKKILDTHHFREVALPLDNLPDPLPPKIWSTCGWLAGTEPFRLHRERTISKPLADSLPELTNIRAVRGLLGIKSPRQLGWMLWGTDQVEQPAPYIRFAIPKRDGSIRTICAPAFSLLRVQRKILATILNAVPPHPAAHGFVRGRSTVTNAAPHCGAPLLLKFDLEDFFTTIHYFRVVGLFLSLGYGMSTGRFSRADKSLDVAPVLARLCCYTQFPRRYGNGYLPQGAPTSPAISNLICRRLDARLTGLAEKFGGVYTRYADDLTFSFQDQETDVARFRWWVDQVCHHEGFLVNQAKFRVIRDSQRQTVTGIVVNDTLQIPREARRRFRAMLHNCQQQGVAAASRGDPGFASYLQGFASYYAMVDPLDGRQALLAVKEALRRVSGEGETS